MIRYAKAREAATAPEADSGYVRYNAAEHRSCISRMKSRRAAGNRKGEI